MINSLKKARIVAGYKTATDAIHKFGWKASIYRAHESGSLEYDIETAMTHAKAYGISLSYLGFDERKSANKILVQ